MKKQLVLILLSFFFFGKAGAQNISSAERDSLYSVVNNLSAKIDKLEKELKYRSLYVDCMELASRIEISNHDLQHCTTKIVLLANDQKTLRRSSLNDAKALCDFQKISTEQNKIRIKQLQDLLDILSSLYHFGDLEKEVIERYLGKARLGCKESKLLQDQLKGILDAIEDYI